MTESWKSLHSLQLLLGPLAASLSLLPPGCRILDPCKANQIVFDLFQGKHNIDKRGFGPPIWNTRASSCSLRSF